MSVQLSNKGAIGPTDASPSSKQSSVNPKNSNVALEDAENSTNIESITEVSSQSDITIRVEQADKPSSGELTQPAKAVETSGHTSVKARKRTIVGCITCRKRRIRCGQERPSCQNCVRSKRECEGYTPRAVFKDPFGFYRPVQKKSSVISKENNMKPAPKQSSLTSEDRVDKTSEPGDSLSSFPECLHVPVSVDNAGSTISVPIKNKMQLITSKIIKRLSVEHPKASLHLKWDLLTFIKSQFVENQDTTLGSIVTLSGSGQYAQATTCLEYAEQNWSSQGSSVIKAFQSAIDDNEHISSVTNTDSQIDIDLRNGMCILVVQSHSLQTVAEIVQQVIWMGCALQTSRYERVQYSTFRLSALAVWETSIYPSFSVTFDMSVIAEQEKSCWLPLFANPVIAQGFPVPERENGEHGLEVPLEIMAALGGARHVTDFEGGLVLKGHSAMFVPVKRHHQSVQWHLIRTGEEQRVLYRDVNNECPTRAMLSEVDYESLADTRAFLGWWRSAETHLGTADAAYNSIDWSPAGETKRTAKISGAALGFQNILTGQLNFQLGAKDGRLHFSQKGPFQRIVQCAEKTCVVLYDTDDRRGWFVPALDVMLHVVQTRHHISPYTIDGKLVDLTPATPKNARAAAKEAITANQKRQLYEQDIVTGKNYYFQDAILDIWSQMERLMEKEDSIEACTGLALRGTMQSRVSGWEYMSLVHEKNYRRKEATIAKSCGGWVDLVNDVDCLVLFATGLGEIIRPVSDLSGLCQPWKSLPKGKDFLAAGVPIMELLYSEAGSRLSRKYLSTSHLQWHRGSTLFEQCNDMTSNRCKCDRTQQIYHDSMFGTFGHVRPPGKLEENGCLIFGQVHHSLKPTTKPSAKQNPLCKLPIKYKHSSTVASSSSMQEDCITTSGLDIHSNSHYDMKDRTRPPSTETSPLSPRRNIGSLKPEMKRRRLLHSKKDGSKDLDEAMEEVPFPTLLKHGGRKGNGSSALDAHATAMKTIHENGTATLDRHGIPKKANQEMAR